MSYHVRQGLVNRLAMARRDKNVQAVVLHCEGRTFFPGMDITEFANPNVPDAPTTVIEAFEGASKPVVTAIHALWHSENDHLGSAAISSLNVHKNIHTAGPARRS